MKKITILLLFLISALFIFADKTCDAILTTNNYQISCVVSNIGDAEVQYTHCPAQENIVQNISVSQIKKIFLSDGTVMDYTKGTTPVITKNGQPVKPIHSHNTEDNAQKAEDINSSVITTPKIEQKETNNESKIEKEDIIITTDAKKVSAKIIEVSKNEIKYKEIDNLDGPTFVLETKEINTIIYANGKVSVFGQNEIASQSSSISQQNQVTQEVSENINLARVENNNGVLVFTDCTPVAQYEIIGEVNNATNTSSQGSSSSFISSGGLGGLGGFMYISSSGGSTPQYTDIRNQLIVNAVMANRDVEGIIISLPKYGEGRASLIKFKDQEEDHSLAKVNSHMGFLVFTDCKPINAYSFVGKINKAGGHSPDYNDLRDRLIKKAQKKYPNMQGIIPRFVTGDHDSAEVIKF